MATNIVASGANEPDDEGDSKTPVLAPKQAPGLSGPAFFTIYKKGQGKWTRLGTIFVAGLLGILTAFNLYHYILPYLPASMSGDRRSLQLLLGICVLFLAVFGLFVFWITNKPGNVDFLIATDSEMKKVNWTTKGELLGSTRIVVVFLFFIAVFLSLVDLVFYELFHFIKVLE